MKLLIHKYNNFNKSSLISQHNTKSHFNFNPNQKNKTFRTFQTFLYLYLKFCDPKVKNEISLKFTEKVSQPIKEGKKKKNPMLHIFFLLHLRILSYFSDQKTNHKINLKSIKISQKRFHTIKLFISISFPFPFFFFLQTTNNFSVFFRSTGFCA